MPDEGSALDAEIREFCERLRLAQRYREIDERPVFPWKEFRALGSVGWLGPRFPAALGGRGWAPSREARLVEGLARWGGSVFAKLVLQPGFSSVLAAASVPVRERWLTPLFHGEVLVGNQITEPGAGSDAGALLMTATLEPGPGEPTYVLNGTKSGIAFAEEAQAAIVYARTGGEGTRGVSAFLVPQDLRGIQREGGEDLGERWMRRGTVHYDRVRVPRDHRIGEEGAAFGLLASELRQERVLLSLVYLGLARASLDEVERYVMGRRAFGRPLGSFEGVSFPLMEDEARWSAAHLLSLEAVRHMDDGSLGDAESALAKWFANETSLVALDHAMQFSGGAGYSHDTLHELRWRDVRSGKLAHGSSEILLLVAAREILGRESLPYRKVTKDARPGSPSSDRMGERSG